MKKKLPKSSEYLSHKSANFNNNFCLPIRPICFHSPCKASSAAFTAKSTSSLSPSETLQIISSVAG